MQQQKKKQKSKLINFKVNEYEYTKLLSKARRYFGGNVSELLRTAGINYKHDPKLMEQVHIENQQSIQDIL